jgi:hypothetical protein
MLASMKTRPKYAVNVLRDLKVQDECAKTCEGERGRAVSDGKNWRKIIVAEM